MVVTGCYMGDDGYVSIRSVSQGCYGVFVGVFNDKVCLFAFCRIYPGFRGIERAACGFHKIV